MATLHDQAVALATSALNVKEHLGSKSGRIIVAVLRHDCEAFVTNTGKEIDRFLWIKGRAKITVARVREVYLQQYGDPTLGLRFLHGDEEPSLDTRMDDLEPRFGAGDQHVALRAVSDETNIDTTPSSTAFTPSRSSVEASVGPSPRRPLQPVVRQPTVPSAPRDSPTKLTDTESSEIAANPKLEMLQAWNRENHGTPVQPPSTSPTRNVGLHSPQKPQLNPSSFGHPTSVANGASVANASQLHVNQHAHPLPALTPQPDFHRRASQEVKPSTQEGDTYESPYKPRQMENPFDGSKGVDSASSSQQAEDFLSQERGLCLHRLTKEESTEKLEAAVQQGLTVLSALEHPLNKLPDSADAVGWLQQIEDLRKQAVRTRTIVGVVGNTGAGKSSVINAMLDEERLVPTNCMRACTAVVTEMSWNDAKSEMSRYRAEIEFIQPEDWLKELKILFKEAFDEEGRMLREAANADTEAGIAATKIRAVYHKYTKEMLGASTPEKLMQVKKVKDTLGTTRTIRSRDAASFYRQLQGYVDSKEKAELDKNGNKKSNPRREFEYWPLIKVVRIYTKADALSTGAVIVDLPGVHDSNAARSAVAAGYMKQCTGLWIVAPINRAVDDKAAKHLLGETFKRQLKYDGTYSSITFICSKTDDISKTEAIDSLKLSAETREMDDELESIERQLRKLKKDMNETKAKREDYGSAIDDIENQLEQWEPLETVAESGKIVYAPSTRKQQKKRKRSSVGTSESTRKQKRRRITLDSDDSDDSDSAFEDNEREDTSASNDEDGTEDHVALTLEEVQTKIKELRELKKDARRERAGVDEELKALRKQIASLNDRYDEIETEQTLLCINERNKYSRRNIQLDFAQGIKELDQENAAEEDPDNFDPEEDIRDYDQVADSLPVFTVSSRAYQKLSGRMKKDNDVPGFKTAEDTEIPQLQAHCKKLTEKGRQASCRRFLNSLYQLMNSMALWASDDGSGLKMTAQQRGAEESFLARKLKDLEKALEKCVRNVCEDMVATLNERIFEKLDPAVDVAARAALPTAQGWGAHRDDGGLYWATYKATVRRNGVFRMDFNQQLTDPIYKHLASTWEKAFQRRLPVILNSFSRSASTLLRDFHAAIETRSRSCGIGIARIGMLGNQLKAHEAFLGEIATTMIGSLNEGQREINREFTPIILAAMTPAYEFCTNESGKGSYKRMKDGMASHVEQNCKHMFDKAANQVTESLKKMCKQVQKNMLDRADALFIIMKRDYMTMLGGATAAQQVILPREERVMRREVDEAIDQAEALFRTVVDGSEEELKALVGPVAAETESPECQEVEMQSEIEDISDDEPNNSEEGNEQDGSEEQVKSEEGHSAGSAEDEDGDFGGGSDLD